MTASEHPVADIDDFDGDGSRMIVEVEGTEIAVFNVDGDYYAVANHCVHQGGPLCEGEVTGQLVPDDAEREWGYEREKHVRCPWHGWTFDVTTGENILDGRYAAPTYEVVERDGTLFVVA